MTRLVLALALTTVLFCGKTVAKEGDFGLGVIVGEPTGLSGKLWTEDSTAVDGVAAWSFGKRSALHLHADYLFHNFGLFKVEKGKLPIYFGIGGRIKFEDNSKVGVRIPVGIEYIFTGAPLDIFLELVPLLDLVPSTEFRFNGGIGVRYFF